MLLAAHLMRSFAISVIVLYPDLRASLSSGVSSGNCTNMYLRFPPSSSLSCIVACAVVAEPEKKSKINALAFSKVSGYFKETYNISFTKKEFLALLSKWGYIENCYIEKYDSCKWCPTEKGLLSGDIIKKRSALYLTQQGLEKVINYLKDYYYII